jgi:hypothetical protein
MSGQDQSVTNLERFIGHLVQAAGALQRIGGHIEDSTSALEPFGHAADADGNGLNTQLEHMDSTLANGTREAIQALGEAMKAANEGAAGVSGRRESATNAADDVQVRSGTVESTLRDAEASLVADGFEALLHVLGALEAGVGAATDEAVKESGALENTCEQLEQDSQRAWDAAQSELDDGKATCEQAEDSLQGERTKSVDAFEDQASHLESTCSAALDQVGALYDTLETTVQSEGVEWAENLEHEREQAAELIAEAAKDRLGSAVEMATEAGLGALSDEYQILSPVVFERTHAVSESAEAVAPDAAAGLNTIPKIRQLLEALAG